MKLKFIGKILLVLMLFSALAAVGQTPAAAPQPPLTHTQVVALLAGDVPSSRVTMLVQQRGINFTSTDAILDQVRKAGGDDDLVAALKAAKVTANASVPPPAPGHVPDVKQPQTKPDADAPDDAKQAQVAQFAQQGAELMMHNHFAEAQTQYRNAIHLDPNNAALHIALSRALNSDRQAEDGMKEARLAIRLDPESDLAYFSLGNSLRLQKNYAGAEREYREAIKLNPDYDMTHNNLGFTLKMEGNLDGAIAEYREAIRLNPRGDIGHANLGNALEEKGDLEGAISQYQELARMHPKSPGTHFRLGQLFEKNGNPRKALVQFRMASDLAPNNRQYKEALDRASSNQP
jgi:tetratricopeptide (TPR) repeat protein